MAIIPTDADYTQKDRASLLRRIRSLIDSVDPNWTETEKANFGNMLVELFAFVGDKHLYYMDKLGRESRWTTAQLRRSLLGLIKLIEYVPVGRSAATVDVDITLQSTLAGDLTLTAGSTVRTRGALGDQVQFQLLADVTIDAGQTSMTGVSVENSESHEQNLASDGLPNQTFRLLRTPFLEQASVSPIVTFADGTYTQVGDLLDSTSTSKHFVLQVDQDERATLVFGNGVNGAIPQGTGVASYKTGGGVAGNVEPGDVKVFEGTHNDDLGNVASIQVTNPLGASGGADRESNAEVRQNAPRAARVVNRAVAREDYEIVAEQVAGVARALSLTSEEEEAVGENQGYLFIVPEGGGTASSALLDAVKGRFRQVTDQPAPTHPHINTFDLVVQTAPYEAVDHVVRSERAPGFTNAQMKLAIETVLADFYSLRIKASRLIAIAPKAATAANVTAADGVDLVRNPLVDFGFNYKGADGAAIEALVWSTVFNVVRDLPEVAKLDAANGLLLDGERLDVTLGNFNFPTLGTVTVIDDLTGNTL